MKKLSLFAALFMLIQVAFAGGIINQYQPKRTVHPYVIAKCID